MLIGYARVSTTDQNLTLQKDALEKAGCERIYEDELSGTKDNRPGLLKAIEMLRENDTLVVWKLDRLGRSVKSLIELISELNSKNIHFKSLTDSIDTSTPSGRFFFHALFGFKSKSSATLTTLSLLLIINCTVESLNS